MTNPHDTSRSLSSTGRTVAVTTLSLAVALVVWQFGSPCVERCIERAGYAWASGAADAAAARLKTADDISGAYRQVAAAIRPSVVFITASKVTPRRVMVPEFRDRMGRLFFREMPAPDEVRSGLGSGVIVTPEGHILTNNHVVAGFDRLEVHLTGGAKAPARIIGTDPATDVAVIKIDRDGLRPATLGNSDRVEVGEIVIAAGNPFGLEQTVTQGIISAKGRANLGLTDYEDFLQTDAAINPGNSGGPLLNLRGEVIGINTAIFSRSGGYQGIGFAIPINLAADIMKRLIQDGRVNRGWLGVSIQDLSEQLRASFKAPADLTGVLIGDTEPNGPAARAGLQAGDILCTLDGQPVRDVNALRNRVAAIAPGQSVKATIFRNGQTLERTLTVGELPAEVQAANAPPPENAPNARDPRALNGRRGGPAAQPPAETLWQDRLGLTVQRLDTRAARLLGTEADSAVVVSEVVPNGPAARAGLVPGDLITAVGQTATGTPDALAKAIEAADLKAGVRLTVRSAGRSRFVVLSETP